MTDKAKKLNDEINKSTPPPLPAERSKALTVPQDLLDHAGAGAEDIRQDDIRPPRLALAQSMSPEVKRGDAKFIDNLREGNFFNSLTGENLGDGPIKFVVIKYLGTRGMEFAPFGSGGGIIDGEVPLEDERMKFHTDPVTKKRLKPKATKFMDFLIWLPESQEMMVLSTKNTQLKKAVVLASLLTQPLKISGSIIMKPPVWARTFTVSSGVEKKGDYSYANFVFRPEGITDQEIREGIAILYESLKSKKVVVDVDETPDTPEGVDPDAPDAEREM